MSALQKDAMLNTLDGECPLEVGKFSAGNNGYFGSVFSTSQRGGQGCS